MTYFLICLALLVVGIVVRAFLLPLVQWLVMGWTRLYTLRLSREVRARRRAEVRSDLWEQASAQRELGYRPESMALHHLLRCLFGIPADVSWRCAQTRPSQRTHRSLLVPSFILSLLASLISLLGVLAGGFGSRALVGTPPPPIWTLLGSSLAVTPLATLFYYRTLVGRRRRGRGGPLAGNSSAETTGGEPHAPPGAP